MSKVQDAGELAPDEFVDTCLDLMGPLDLDPKTRQELIDHAAIDGSLAWGDADFAAMRVSEMLQLIVSLRDYQYA